YDKKAMNRKRMMKLFREYMSLQYPSRGKPKSAFAVGDSYAASGEPDSDTLRDASSVELRALSNQGRGNPRQSNKRKMDGQSTRTKQIPERNSAKAGDMCPACEQRHEISDCYYVNKAKAPEWFKPNRGIARLVQYKLENDTNLQRTMQEMSPETKRPRFSTESLALELGRGDGLEVASDASFADNTLDRKSSQGYAIKLFGGLIAWRA
ncbi:hypothetical protein TUN205_11930, partial [Pyrenophora tritici-repentis]